MSFFCSSTIYLKPFLMAFFISIIIFFCLQYFWRGRVHVFRFGGAALILVFLLVFFLDKNLVIDRAWWGMIIAVFVILIYGLWDDFKNLKPGWQLLFQFLAVLILVGAGVRVDYITSPLGGVIRFDQPQLLIANYQLPVLGFLFILFWLFLTMNAVNWLDGIDGAAGGVGLVGFVVIFILSISKLVNQPPIGIAAVILAGALLGFLLFNFPRRGGAKIILGTSGSVFLGFMLGALSIFSGSKIATALLVLSIPVLDAVWVIWHRWSRGESIFRGDKTHLHHRLIKAGVSASKITTGLIVFGAFVGIASLFLRTSGKMIALVFLITAVFLFFRWLERGIKD